MIINNINRFVFKIDFIILEGTGILSILSSKILWPLDKL